MFWMLHRNDELCNCPVSQTAEDSTHGKYVYQDLYKSVFTNKYFYEIEEV